MTFLKMTLSMICFFTIFNATAVDDCLFDLKVGEECKLGMDSVTPIRLIAHNMNDFQELLKHGDVMTIVATKKKNKTIGMSDKLVVTFTAGTYAGFVGKWLKKATLSLESSYDMRVRDSIRYKYSSSGVKVIK